MKKIRPNDQRAKYALTLLWIVLMLEVIVLFSNYLQFDLLINIQEGENYTMEELEANDLRVSLFFWIYLASIVLTAVLFIRWFRRAYYNLHLNVRHLNQSEGWAAGAWFVPIINLYRPFQIMKELYSETTSLLKRNFGKEVYLPVAWVGSWWALWIISGLLGRISMQFLKKENTVENLISSTEVDMAINLIGIPLALVAIRVVKKYSEAEQIMYNLINEEQKNPKSTEVGL